MRRDAEAAEDIRRLLAMTWRTWGDTALEASAISRTWSLDLGWLSPVDAEELLAKLVAGGWLTSSGEGLHPTLEIDGVDVPLGWFPRGSLLGDPPLRATVDSEKGQLHLVTPLEAAPVEDEKRLSNSPTPSQDVPLPPTEIDSGGGWNIPSLLQSIATSSQLPKQEVMRRARHKCNRLGDVTLWMALILVGREQNIDITTLLNEK